MRLELFVALRYLRARRTQAFIAVISLMSVLGVALGVAALVIVLGVYNGFSTDIRGKLLSANAQVVVSDPEHARGEGSARDPLDTAKALLSVPGVTGAAPFIYTEGMISTPRGVKGLIIRGVDPSGAPGTIAVLRSLTAGNVADLDGEGLPGIVLGRELAARLGLRVGSRASLLSPSGQTTSAGFQPRVMSFKVVGIFQSGLFEYDTSVGYVSLAGARALANLRPGAVSGIELAVADPETADAVAAEIGRRLGPGVSVRHWMEMNANLFAALRLEKLGMFIILAMVVLIGSFSIVTTLVMMVMEKTKDIAVLMSMGVTKAGIRRIFMWQGTLIGLVGVLLGDALGIGLGTALQRYQFVKLPTGVYTVDHLPVLLQWSDIALVSLCAMLLCFLATIYPSGKAAALEPATALRYE